MPTLNNYRVTNNYHVAEEKSPPKRTGGVRNSVPVVVRAAHRPVSSHTFSNFQPFQSIAAPNSPALKVRLRNSVVGCSLTNRGRPHELSSSLPSR